ncbi:MAG: hypothetical protein B7Z10_09935 [Rhodobacterales bacterium 32-66-7]|nr:MAG: hypothetical protein B7Z10_09935 [Rhodobacterales bacterium 32-66-7]
MIALLHRTSKGWHTVGEVGFDAPDLGDAVDYLRKTALGLSPLGMATKIVLPASQILYTDVHAPGPSDADLRRQIATALEGRTPYAVADLVFDWSGSGPIVQVAVVARETLDEAEAFAVQNRLNPVSFVAVPEPGSFAGEVWFGPTMAAAGILAAGETVERDAEPVVILQRDLPMAEVPRSPDPAEDLPGLEEALNADLPVPAPDMAALVPEADPFTPDLEDEVDSLPGGSVQVEAFQPEPVPSEPVQPKPVADPVHTDPDQAAVPSDTSVHDADTPVVSAANARVSEDTDAPLPARDTEAAPLADEPAVEEAPFAEVPPDDAEDLDAALEAAARQASLSEEFLAKEMALQMARAQGGRPAAALGSVPDAPPQPLAASVAGPVARLVAERAPAQALRAADLPDADLADADLVEVAGDALIHATSTASGAASRDPSALSDRGARLLDEADDDVPPAPPSAAMLAFASRRAALAAAGASPAAPVPLMAKRDAGPGLAPGRGVPPVPKAVPPALAAALTPAAPASTGLAPDPMRPDPMRPDPMRPAGTVAARPSPAKAATGLVTAPRIPGTRIPGTSAKAKGKAADIAPSGPQGARSPMAAGGTFGLAKPRRNRTGLVFLVLVGLLLASLVAVAAWSSFLRDTTNTATAIVPDVEDEMLADMQDPEGLTEPLPEAADAFDESLAAPADGTIEAATDPATDPATVDLTDTALLDPASLESEPLPINLAEAEATDLPIGTLADPAAKTADPAPDAAPDTEIETDIAAATTPVEDQDEIFLPAMDAPPTSLDALALPSPAATVDARPEALVPPPAFGTVYQFDANGLLLPTAEGILSPDGVMLIAGQPPLLPPVRSESAAAAAAAAKAALPPAVEPDAPSPEDASLVTGGTDAAAAAVPEPDTLATDEATADGAAPPVDPALANARPRPRPDSLVPASDDDARLATDEDASALARLRPLPRPDSVLVAASASRPADVAGLDPTDLAAPDLGAPDLGAQGASLAAQAAADLAAAMALEASDPSIVAISMRPMPRPRDFSAAVEAAVAAAAREPEPEPKAEIIEVAAAPAGDLKPEELAEIDEPGAVDKAPSIPTSANVAKQATFSNAINLSKINLIGTYGTNSNRYAWIRQSNGRLKKVEVGDKIDGGRVEAITETEVRYQKNGKLVALKMPKA